jgi:Xaa-Pro aminopeptidase
MLQIFTKTSQPQEGAARLQKLRDLLTQRGYDGFLVPRADAHQGEYVGPHDERLAYVSGFTGSAGFLIILPQIAGVFIDGRYRTQVKTQVDLSVFTPVEWPETDAGTWIVTHLARGRVAFDPWLHTSDEIEKLTRSFEGRDITLCPTENLVDLIWHDQPKRSCSPAFVQPNHLAGQTMDEKKLVSGKHCRRAGLSWWY